MWSGFLVLLFFFFSVICKIKTRLVKVRLPCPKLIILPKAYTIFFYNLLYDVFHFVLLDLFILEMIKFLFSAVVPRIKLSTFESHFNKTLLFLFIVLQNNSCRRYLLRKFHK